MERLEAKGLTRALWNRLHKGHETFMANIYRHLSRPAYELRRGKRYDLKAIESISAGLTRDIRRDYHAVTSYSKCEILVEGKPPLQRAAALGRYIVYTADRRSYLEPGTGRKISDEKVFSSYGFSYLLGKKHMVVQNTSPPFFVTDHTVRRFLMRSGETDPEKFFNSTLLKAMMLSRPLLISMAYDKYRDHSLPPPTTLILPYGQHALLSILRANANHKDRTRMGRIYVDYVAKNEHQSYGYDPIFETPECGIYTFVDQGITEPSQDFLIAELNQIIDDNLQDFWNTYELEVFLLLSGNFLEVGDYQVLVQELRDRMAGLMDKLLHVVRSPEWSFSVRNPRVNWLNDNVKAKLGR